MQKITPFLWFDNQAEEAMHFYTSIFKNAKAGDVRRYGDAGPGPEGSVMTASFELEGQQFMVLNGGPEFAFTPAISLFVNCEDKAEVDTLWEKLAHSGTVLMKLDTYPFSEKFGWVVDKFGVSWQLNLVGGKQKQKIFPFLMFVGEQHGKAEEAINFYVSQFKNSSIVRIERYNAGEGGTEGTVKHAIFSLNGQGFMAMESNGEHPFTFTPAISFFVNCETQEEVDALWEKLSEGGEKDVCGWLKDRYGVSWQIVPANLGTLLSDPDPVKSQKVMRAMMQMRKLDMKALQEAYEGK